MAITKDLVAASGTPMILSILNSGPNYGYAIIKQVRALSGGNINWTDGMLYPVLHRLEKQELIESFWEKSATGRKRKYYRIQDSGQQALKEQQAQWKTVYSAMQKLWEAKPCLT
jgi:PadR family transcriptional regulator PadR